MQLLCSWDGSYFKDVSSGMVCFVRTADLCAWTEEPCCELVQYNVAPVFR